MLPNRPFATIALTLSGGGYRAAAFHLGTLFYLNKLLYNEKPLLSTVKTLSTVSGGSITGAMYAQSLQQGQSFDEFYKELYQIMDRVDLVQVAIDVLTNSREWKPPLESKAWKARNLINSFAKAYDKLIFKGATFDTFFNQQQIHLEDIIINASEFSDGIEFRFFKSHNDLADIGNGNLKPPIGIDRLKEVKLADAVAASSCFPAGFEPIAFPDDFLYRGSNLLNELVDPVRRAKIRDLDLQIKNTEEDEAREKLYQKKERLKQSDYFNPALGLMDGGIVDNQGIESVLRVQENRENGQNEYHDLIIISDVASYFITDFHFVDKKPNWVRSLITFDIGNFSIQGVLGFWRLLALFSAICFMFGWHIPGYVLLTAFMLLLPLFAKLISTYHQKIPHFFRQYLSQLKNLKLKVLGSFVKERMSSVMIMTMEVFLKNLRGLRQRRIYQDKNWHRRRVSNFIYNFKRNVNGKVKPIDKVKGLSISKEIVEVASSACSMPTTLWFTNQHKKDNLLQKLIACGQFTMCYNLIWYLEDLKKDTDYDQLDAQVRAQLKKTLDLAHKHWDQFQKEPLIWV